MEKALHEALDDLQKAAKLEKGKLLIVGTSTSEVIGEHIGSAGSKEVAESIWKVLREFQQKTNVSLAFQCCEHLNRAIVVEKEWSQTHRIDVVSAIPIPGAGGSMAALAYEKLTSPVVVEEIQADAGIDIGDTLIGMHLKKVAVPIRSKVKSIGEAHLSMAITRPKLIGGERAVYQTSQNEQNCH
ncbi:TIGR01440 family protein [Evansella sp. AB-P1]|uniref:TIGR01440 family protein n=1 Tax=Evansella sp. AB-P1 TaxID=3037653 RepID=UPI00241CBC38|nr:TIGR01440 family protein [Evansella sp. AB-P1]MDG5787321.1 TIGR01440 family protein [Evansella sp. AB-P1]